MNKAQGTKFRAKRKKESVEEESEYRIKKSEEEEWRDKDLLPSLEGLGVGF